MGGAAASLAGFFVLAGGSFCGSSMTRVALSAFSGADGLTGSAGAGGTGAGFSRPAGTRGIGTGGSSSVLSTGCSGAASASHSSSHSCSFSFFLEKKERTRFFRGSSSGSSHGPRHDGGKRLRGPAAQRRRPGRRAPRARVRPGGMGRERPGAAPSAAGFLQNIVNVIAIHSQPPLSVRQRPISPRAPAFAWPPHTARCRRPPTR